MMRQLRLPDDFEALDFEHNGRRLFLRPGLTVWISDERPRPGEVGIVVIEEDEGSIVLVGLAEDRDGREWLRHPADDSLSFPVAVLDEPRRLFVESVPDDDLVLFRWDGPVVCVQTRCGRLEEIGPGAVLHLRTAPPVPGRFGLLFAIDEDLLDADVALVRFEADGRFRRCGVDGELEEAEPVPAGALLRAVVGMTLPLRRLDPVAAA